MAPPTGFKSLPRELVLSIAEHLDTQSLGCLSSTNSGMNSALHSHLKKVAKNHAFAPDEYYENAITFDEEGHAVLDENIIFNTPKEPIVKAIQMDCVNAVEGFLNAGIKPNAYSIWGKRLLYSAVEFGAYEVTKLLLDRGADPNLFNLASQNAPLIMAAANSDDDLARTLISAGADVNAPNVVSTIIQHCTLGTLTFAIGHGAVLAETNDSDSRFPARGIPLFHDAALNPSPSVLRFLIAAIPEAINETDAVFDRTALWPAAMADNHLAIYDLVAAGIDIDHLDNAGETLLHQSLRWIQDTEIPAFLLESGMRIGVHGQGGMTEMHYAAEFGAANVVEMFLGENMHPNVRDAQRKTPLHWAAREGHVAVAKVLVEEGEATLDYMDVAGRTPMDIAKVMGQKEFWTYLSVKKQETGMPS